MKSQNSPDFEGLPRQKGELYMCHLVPVKEREDCKAYLLDLY